MKRTLSTYTASRDNNFNLIRFIAASLVLFSHSFALAIGTGDAEPLRSTIGITLGTIAVDIFFISSGFLITSSYFSRSNIIAFLWARVLRIYPALIVSVLFCVFGVGLLFTTHDAIDYILNRQTVNFLVKNSILFFDVEYTLPGVFLNVPYKEAVNGSLWTLPYEIKMYVILAFVLVAASYLSTRLKIVTIRNIIFIFGVASFFFHIFNEYFQFYAGQFIRLFYMFFIGAAFYVWQDKIIISSKMLFIFIVVLIISAAKKDVFVLLYSLLLPLTLFCLVFIPAGAVRAFNKLGDYSYGIYIYAFPVQQSIATLIPNVSVTVMIVLSFVFTLILAMISWHFVEKKFLKMKGAYIYIQDALQKIWLTMRFNRVK